MTNEDYSKVPPPHLLKKFSEQAREDSQKRGHPGYCKTFAKLCIDWALNSKSSPNNLQIRSSDITPPPELVQKWREAPGFSALSPCAMVTVTTTKMQDIATQAAQWGADQELEACCLWLNGGSKIDYDTAALLRAARRPEPPSLKEQALKTLENAPGPDYPKVMTVLDADQHALIRRALEQLDD
jgi:hypothetical protein